MVHPSPLGRLHWDTIASASRSSLKAFFLADSYLLAPMPSFLSRFPSSPIHDVKDTPSLKHSPSTISSTSQSSFALSIRKRVSSIASKLHFRRGRSPSKNAIQHLSSVPWPRTPSRSPSPPSPDIRPPSGLGRRASSISDLNMFGPESPTSPPPPQSPISPSLPAPNPLPLVPPESASLPLRKLGRPRTHSSPALLPSAKKSLPAPPSHRAVVSSSQTFEPRSPRLTRQQARQSPPIPLSFILAHIPRSSLPALALVSRRFCAAAQLALYHTLEPSATDADACVARIAGVPHLAALVSSLVLSEYPPAHGASFHLALALALRSMSGLMALTLPAFNADLLAAAPPSLARLTLLADTLPFAFFDQFLASRPHITHLSLPNFVGVPPGACEVPKKAVPSLVALDASPGLAVALAPDRSLQRVTLRIASTLYDGLRPAAIFHTLGSQLKELVLVLAPDVDARTRGRLLGALANTGGGLEVLELRLEGTFDDVRVYLSSRSVAL
jgi:hypothetical protein